MSALHLTFDDGPDPVWTPAVLDALAASGARATFFVVAPRAAAHPELVAAIHAGGHDVQLHCDEHVRHTELTDAALAEDTTRALARLAAVGIRPALWRAPWGVTRAHSHLVARMCHLTLVHWTADTEDWAGHAPEAMLDRVRAGVRAGGIVLAHDGLGPGALRDGCANTVALIAPLVALAAERGLPCLPLGGAPAVAGAPA